MPKYYNIPFPFDQIIDKKKRIKKDSLETSIRSNIRFLILTRLGEFTFDPQMGFEMWEHDKRVFYHEKEPYYEEAIKETYKGLLENATADKNFTENLKRLITENEMRLENIKASFNFKNVDGNMSVYQRRIKMVVEGRIKSTGKLLNPPFQMEIFYSPFRVESN